jgi:hypothetical protein
MPPCFPHAVFTPEDCLAVGGHIYTAGHLGGSIEGLKLQEDYPGISNEDLDDSVYGHLAKILSQCDPVITPFERSQIATNKLLFPNLPGLTTYDKHTKDSIKNALRSCKVAIPSKATKRQLLELLKENSGTPAPPTPREEFLNVLGKFYERFMHDSAVDED